MRWQGGKQSDNLEDRRRMPVGGMAVGGGGLVLVIALIMLCMGADLRQIFQFLQNAPVAVPGGPAAGPADRPETPEEARSREFAATILGFTEEVWTEQFRQAGQQYVPPKMVLFSQQVRTGCGVAPAAAGPFYCPADRTVYLDPTFFEELEQKMGGSQAEFAQAYVIAHEIGHHVQNLLGYADLVDQRRRSPDFNEWSVRLELQADYLAGVWAHYGQRKYMFIEQGDIASAIKTANSIGDDRIQRNQTGFVSPESFTHGSSAQRVKWFTEGLKTGDLSVLKTILEMPYEQL